MIDHLQRSEEFRRTFARSPDDPRGLFFLMHPPSAYVACPDCGRPQPLHWPWCATLPPPHQDKAHK